MDTAEGEATRGTVHRQGQPGRARGGHRVARAASPAGQQTHAPLTAPQRLHDAGRTIVCISRILSCNKTHYEVTKVPACTVLPRAAAARSAVAALPTRQGTRPHGWYSACLSVTETGLGTFRDTRETHGLRPEGTQTRVHSRGPWPPWIPCGAQHKQPKQAWVWRTKDKSGWTGASQEAGTRRGSV